MRTLMTVLACALALSAPAMVTTAKACDGKGHGKKSCCKKKGKCEHAKGAKDAPKEEKKSE